MHHSDGWETGITGSTHEYPNRTYYWHEETEGSTWEHPLDAFYRDMFRRLKVGMLHPPHR